MTEHKVKGYSPQSEANVSAVNMNKELEETLLRVVDSLYTNPDIDKRWLAIARTHFEEGFMSLNRSIFKPGRITLPKDHGGSHGSTLEDMPTAKASVDDLQA